MEELLQKEIDKQGMNKIREICFHNKYLPQ